MGWVPNGSFPDSVSETPRWTFFWAQTQIHRRNPTRKGLFVAFGLCVSPTIRQYHLLSARSKNPRKYSLTPLASYRQGTGGLKVMRQEGALTHPQARLTPKDTGPGGRLTVAHGLVLCGLKTVGAAVPNANRGQKDTQRLKLIFLLSPLRHENINPGKISPLGLQEGDCGVPSEPVGVSCLSASSAFLTLHRFSGSSASQASAECKPIPQAPLVCWTLPVGKEQLCLPVRVPLSLRDCSRARAGGIDTPRISTETKEAESLLSR